jgi:DNA processing protein
VTSHQKQIAIALLAVAGIGPHTYTKIKSFCEYHQLSLWEWWTTITRSYSLSTEVGISAAQLDALLAFQHVYTPESYWEWLQSQSISVVWEEENEYPSQLTELPGHPVVLFVKGPAHLLQAQTIVGVVGTRKMTSYGEFATRKIVEELVNGGATIVSGGMYGVDLLAHRTTLDNNGQTIVILGFGFGRWYPYRDRWLENDLLQAGALLVTEYAPGTPPNKGTFLQRNRIIAGIAQAVVVTEAAQRSGSLHTAHQAAEYGKNVWAVPGPLTSVYSEGVKNLVNEGAKLATSGYEVLGTSFTLNHTELRGNTDKGQQLDQQILSFLEAQPMGTEELAAQLLAPLTQLLPMLSLLEMQNQIRRRGVVWLKI